MKTSIIPHAITRRVFPWLAAALVMTGCGEKPGARHPQSSREWQTREWPMTRGGIELQGQVRGALPQNPEIAWTFRAKGAVTSEAAVAHGVIVFGDVEGVVYALDLATRKERWRVETKDAIEATPAIASNRVFIGSNDGFFRALDLADGRELWRIKGGEKFPTGGVLMADDESVLVNGYDGVTRCLRTSDGSEVWKHETQDYINGSPAILEGGRVAFGGCDSVIHVIGLNHGEALTQIRTDAQIIRSLAAWGGTVYGVNHANQLVAADTTGGKPAWVFENGDGPFLTIPAVDSECVYVGSRDKHLHAVGRLDGKQLWKFQTGGRVESSPLVFDDAVVFGSGDGRLYAVSKRDGREIWRLDLGEGIANAPAFAGGRIVVGGGDGTLFVIGEGAAK